ncbi:MAG: hypothetical protein DMF86_18525, partial [Acidobacteria bacterium]
MIVASLVALHADVFFMGHTVLPLMQPGITASGPYGYEGFRPDRHVSIDPAGALDAEFTWAAYFVRTVRSGSFPFWNPYQGLGQPQLANYVSAVLYPVNWLNLVLPPAWWDVVFFVDWFLAAYFVYLLARVVRVDREAAVVAALTVFATGFFAGFLGVRSIMGTVPWFPFLLYGIERTLAQPAWRWKSIALGAATYGLATGGHPEPAFLGLVLAIGYFAVRLVFVRRRLEAVTAIVPGLFFGGLLAAPVWLTFAEYVFRDASAVHGFATGTLHFPPEGLALTVFPLVYGPLNMDIWAAQYSTMAWVPAGVTFLAVAGVVAVVRRRPIALGALTSVTLVAAAKIYGVPLINDVGRLPLLRQFWFQYASGFVAVGMCVLAGAGFAYLRRAPVRQWMLPCGAWIVYVLVMLGAGLFTMRRYDAMLTAEPWRVELLRTSLVFGTFWAIAFPGLLFLTRVRGRRARGAFILVAVAGLLLQAIAYFPNGSARGFVVFNIVAAAVFIALVVTAVLLGSRTPRTAPFAIALSVTAIAVVALVRTTPRLANRYNPLRPAPYVARLTREPNAPRLYPLEGVLFPDFAAPFGLSSMTNLENLTPRRPAIFFSEFLDSGVHPARFYGLEAGRQTGAPDALTEFWAHKRYWDLIGVRYVLTGARDPNTQVVSAPPPAVSIAPVPLTTPLESAVACAAGPFELVSVFLSTYASVQPGEVSLDVLDARGVVTATAAVDSTAVVNNAEQSFPLPAPACADRTDRAVLRLRFQP